LALIPSAIVSIPASITPFPNNQLSNNTTGYPLIAPLWDNHSANLISYNVSPANSLWIRWSIKWQNTNPSAASVLFWVKLDGTNNTINFYYANNATYLPTTPSASIGIAGICLGDYYSVNVTSNNSASIDSASENLNIGQGGATTFRPYNCSYTFTPININDNCASATDLGTINGSCTNIQSSTINASTSGSPMCTGSDTRDVFYKFIKPAGVTNVTVTTSPAACQSVTGTTIELFNSCGGLSIACSGSSTANPAFGEISAIRPCSAETLWVKVTADGDMAGKFNICTQSTGGGSGGQTCSNATPICSVPFTLTGLSTAGAGNDYDSTTSACHSIFMNGEDYVFSYTPTATQCIRVSINSTGTNPAVFVYNGCPNTAGTYCLGSAENLTGTATINSVSLTSGQTYYIVVDNYPGSGNTNIPFDISVTSLGSPNAYDVCSSSINLGVMSSSVSCVQQTFSTECSTPTAVGQAGVPSCIPNNNPPSFIDGVTGDVWLRFTAGFSGLLQINTFQSATNPTSNAAMAIYTGAACPSSGATPYACDYNSGSNGMPSLTIPVINGTTYFVRVWTEHPYNQGNFDICFQTGCSPTNDLPCGAVYVPAGGMVSGVNTCAGGTSEPSNAAQCVAGGTINSVWYKTTVPSSGQVRVRTHPLTLTDTQIQGYSFPSGCMNSTTSFIARTCNDDGTACSGGFNDFSEQLFTGLTPGDTLWVAVDGVNSLTGSFEISFINGTGTIFPPVYQQDCAGAEIVCSTTDIVVADPGFRNNGNVCDLPSGYGCWGTGERNSSWYQLTVDPSITGGTATLSLDVLTSQSNVDMNFIMWDVTGVNNPCALIQAQTLPVAGCNYSTTSFTTGLSVASPAPFGYDNAITFTGAPRTYLLLLNNFNSAANAGYTLHWGGTPPPIASYGTSATWTGNTDINYATTTNWGLCGTRPNCGIDAVINATANGRQPVINGTESVRNITINPGATLTISAGSSLSVCGSFTNLGTLICQLGSTINFIGSASQTINGNFNVPNSFPNLVINKTSGSVVLQTNIDVAENFTVSNATSIFNIGGKYMKLGGHFTNWNSSTFTGIGGSTIEFNGMLSQNYSNTNGIATLNRVKINKPSGKVYLTGSNSSMNIDSVLTLSSGNIATSSTLEVYVKYGNASAIVSHSSNSFINGRLRRKMFLGSIDFPVGDSLVPNQAGQKGYELANITFTSSTVIPDILAWFNVWPGSVPGSPAVSDFCNSNTISYGQLPFLNNGYWSFQRSAANFNGIYNVTLYNTGGSNASGAIWTVASAPLAASPLNSSSWSLLGTCSSSSTLSQTKRNQINSPATSATSFNQLYASMQTAENINCPAIATTQFSSCNGSGTGSAYININSTFVTPVNYAVDGGVSQTVNANPFIVSALNPGNHSVIYTTNTGCIDTIDVLIVQESLEDNNMCTIDYCDSLAGTVMHQQVNTNDNNACTDDACDVASGSISHILVNTNDNNACTVDGCDPVSGIYHSPVPVDDNNGCTIDDCDPATGNINHTTVNTNDNDACTLDACDPPTGIISHVQFNIDDNNACTIDACNAATGNVTHTNINTNDNNACTSDGCDPSTGTILHSNINIDDSNICTVDICDPASGISHNPVNTSDNDACTIDGCNTITGITHELINVDDNNSCTQDICNSATGIISHPAIATGDNNICTTDGCDPLTGIYHNLINYDDNNSCTQDDCDPTTGISHNAIVTSDGNACTSDFCDPAFGVFHIPVNSTDNDACTNDGCDPLTGVIIHSAVNTDDNNACTVDGCDPQTGLFHNVININDNDACTLDGCDIITGVSHIMISIDDSDVCTIDNCNSTTGAISHTYALIDDGNSCTIDGCDPTTGIYHTTANEVCDNGIDDNCNGTIDENCSLTLQLKLFIEGYYIGNNQMTSAIDPFNMSVTCDTILVELRESAYPYNVQFFRRGTIDIYGIGNFNFPLSIHGNSFFIVIKHRNAIQTWSASPVLFTNNFIYYSFTDAINKAYGNNLSNLGDGNFALWSGDIIDAATNTIGSQDGVVESSDYSTMENAIGSILIGYNPEDLTGDWVVESLDYTLMENNLVGIIFSMHP
jgi:hypothetical protein